MSWYVERLLLDREMIRENLSSIENDHSSMLYDPELSSMGIHGSSYISLDLESDAYLDLLTLEKKIRELFEKKLLTDFEIKILESVMENKPISKIEEKVGAERHFISEKFKEICDKIAYYLGNQFTDEGYIFYIKEKYNLNKEQLELLYKIITNKRLNNV